MSDSKLDKIDAVELPVKSESRVFASLRARDAAFLAACMSTFAVSIVFYLRRIIMSGALLLLLGILAFTYKGELPSLVLQPLFLFGILFFLLFGVIACVMLYLCAHIGLSVNLRENLSRFVISLPAYLNNIMLLEVFFGVLSLFILRT